MIPYLILIISFIMDGVLTNFLPFLVNQLSLFTPELTVISIFIIYPFFRKQEKKYYIISFIVGILYDLCYTNLLFFNGVLFVGMAVLAKRIYHNYENNFIRNIFYITLVIVLYESLSAGIFYVFQLVPITLERVIYKISHSLLLNIIYAEMIYIVLKLLPKKYKKISIN